MADKGVGGALEEFLRRSGLNHFAVRHDNDLVGKCQGFGLVVGDVNHGDVELAVDFLELRAQFPFQMRVDHGERFVEQDRRDIGADKAAPE